MDYGIGDEEGPLEQAKALFATYAKYFLLLAVVAGAAYYFVYLAPKSASASVTVREIDGEPLPNVEVFFATLDGKSVGTSEITDASGSAVFFNLPARTALRVTANAGAGFARDAKVVELNPAPEGNSVPLEVARRSPVRFIDNGIPPALSRGCKDRFQVRLGNYGAEVADAELVAEGDEAFVKAFSFQGQPKQIYANESGNITLVVEAPESGDGNALSGSIRLKRSREKIDLSLSLQPKVEVEVSESSIVYTSGSDDVRLLTVRNTGKQPLYNFQQRVLVEEKLREQCGSDGAGCFKIEVLGSDAGVIPPGSSLQLILRITPPDEKNDYFASLLLSGTCLANPGLSIPIRLNLKEQA